MVGAGNRVSIFNDLSFKRVMPYWADVDRIVRQRTIRLSFKHSPMEPLGINFFFGVL